MKNFYNFFIRELRDVYNSELLLIKVLPRMAEKASDPELRKAFFHHYEETQEQVKRLQEIGKIVAEDLNGEVCKAMQGLIGEGRDMLRTPYEEDTKDVVLITTAQKIEHYEISAYGSLKVCAKHLSLSDVESLLLETFKEEVNAEKKLTKIAEGTLFHTGLNAKASAHCCIH